MRRYRPGEPAGSGTMSSPISRASRYASTALGRQRLAASRRRDRRIKATRPAIAPAIAATARTIHPHGVEEGGGGAPAGVALRVAVGLTVGAELDVVTAAGVCWGVGVAEAVADGVADGVLDGAADGVLDGVADGVLDGVGDGVLERVAFAVDGALDGVAALAPWAAGGVPAAPGVREVCGGVRVTLAPGVGTPDPPPQPATTSARHAIRSPAGFRRDVSVEGSLRRCWRSVSPIR